MSGPVVLLLRLLLALSLYLFLGYSIWTLWRDLRQTGASVVQRRTPAIQLHVRNGHQALSSRTFSQLQVFLGRDPGCDIRLSDRSVSARHALLSYHHAQWWLEDLDSRNGTRLNRERVRTPTVLASGDQIQCGHASIVVSLPGDEGLDVTANEES